MQYDNMIEVFNIFNKYDNNGMLHAEHDTLYAGPDPEIVSAKDTARLAELGWNADGDGSFMLFT